MEIEKDYIKIRKPDDCHNHLRDGEILKLIAPTLNIYGRVVAMGNLPKPVVSAEKVKEYRQQIEKARGYDSQQTAFIPVMTVMFANYLTPEILKSSYLNGARILKLIPRGASSNSEHGVSFYELPEFYPVISQADDLGMILSIHAELAHDQAGEEIPYLKRELASLIFIKNLIKEFPNLKIILEHLSTKDMIEFVSAYESPNLAASLTEKHALMKYSDVCSGQGHVIRPQYFCHPIFKFRADRTAVRRTMTSGHKKFFFGSDSAPHSMELKTSKHPAAGIYSHAEETLAILTEIFEKEHALSNLEKFVSENWARFIGCPLNKEEITIAKLPHIIPRAFGNIPVFKGAQKVNWTVIKN